MQQQTTTVTIPDDLPFSDLHLTYDPDGGVSFDWAAIERICEESGLSAEMFLEAHEDTISGLIVCWYQAHRQRGGESDPVAEDLIAEIEAEERAGQTVCHQPGNA